MKSDKQKQQKTKAIFIDRDGTLIEEVNFLHRVADLRFFSYTIEAVKLLKKNGFLVLVVTNQSGIGRGIYTENDMHAIHEQIQADLTEKLDGFYFCPHLPDEGCACRKPNPGMIEAAMRDYAIDLENSWIIGDKLLDIETGFDAEIKTALVLTGYGRYDVEKLTRTPDLIAENLLEAVRKITEN
ncbi:D-glycero-beta-D-manno-heptose 1,7-bisphosphate 7-phosphatase [soil metagenome]